MMVRASLPPGFRFHPTDVELIMYYLKRKVMGKNLLFEAVAEVNIYKFSPWDLPDKSCLKSKDLEWYFFCPRERKYASGHRMNRATETGYWKTTGKDRLILYNGNAVGMVKTLVFHQGTAPQGKRTDWVIYEYRIEDKNLADRGIAQDAYVLCKVFHKNGPGPKNGAQYGAPFQEEDWDDDCEVPVDSLPPDAPSPLVLAIQKNQNSSAALSIVDPGHSSLLSEPGPSAVWPSVDEVLLKGHNSSIVTSIVDPANMSGCSLSKAGVSVATDGAHEMILDTQDDEMECLLASFSDDSPCLPTENNGVAYLEYGRKIETAPHLDGSDPFNGVEDPSNLAELNGGGLNFSNGHEIGCMENNMLPQDDMAFLELDDLNSPLNFSTNSCGIGEIQPGGLYRRHCNFSESEHMLTGSLSPHYYNINSDLRQFWYSGDFPGYDQQRTDLLQLPNLPESSARQGNSATVLPSENVYNSTNPGYNLYLTSYKQEEIRNAAGQQERGVKQRNFFSRLQLLLESIPADPDGSSIHAKAEVTYRFNACTKDALSVMMEGSTFMYSYWSNLPAIEFRRTLADCRKESAVLFYLRSVSPFVIILLMILQLFIELGSCFWNCFCVFEKICWLKTSLDYVLFNLSLSKHHPTYFKIQCIFLDFVKLSGLVFFFGAHRSKVCSQ